MARILVVDEEMEGILFRRMLEEAGHQCAWVQTGAAMLGYLAYEDTDAVVIAVNNTLDLSRLLNVTQLENIGVVGRVSRPYVNGEREAFPFVDEWVCMPYEAATTRQAIDTVLSMYGRG